MHLDALLGYLREALAQTNVRCSVAVGDTHLLARDRDETTDPKAEACPQSNKVETCAKEERFICKLHVILSMTIPQVRGNHRSFGSAPAPWPLDPRRYYVDLDRGQKKKKRRSLQVLWNQVEGGFCARERPLAMDAFGLQNGISRGKHKWCRNSVCRL